MRLSCKSVAAIAQKLFLCQVLFGIAPVLSEMALSTAPEWKYLKEKKMGSQPSLKPPEWWPKWNNTHVTYLYRAMRPDLDDIHFVKHEAMDFAPDSDELRVAVLQALGHGSRERSP